MSEIDQGDREKIITRSETMIDGFVMIVMMTVLSREDLGYEQIYQRVGRRSEARGPWNIRKDVNQCRKGERRSGLSILTVDQQFDLNESRELKGSRGRIGPIEIEAIGTEPTGNEPIEETATGKSTKAEMPSLLVSALLVQLWELMLSRMQPAMTGIVRIAIAMNEKNDAEETETMMKNLEGGGIEIGTIESMSTLAGEIPRKGGIVMMICHHHPEMV